MVEAELGFFEVQFELFASHAMKLRQPMFGIAPEGFDAVDVSGALDEFVVTVIDPKVLLQTQINQPIVASPAIGMDDAAGIDLASDDGLQRGFGGIGNDFGVNTVAAFEQAKDDGLAAGATPAFASDALGAEIGFIGFKLARKRRLSGAFLGQTGTDALVHRIDRAHGKAAQLCGIRGGQVHGKQTQKLAKFCLTDFRMTVVPIFAWHFKKLACVQHMFAS